MRPQQIDANSLELRGRDGARAPILVGIAFLVGPTLGSLGAPAPLTGAHLVTIVVLSTIGCGLVWVGWPRAHVVRVVGSPAHLESKGRTVTPGTGAALRLVDAPPRHATGMARYGVALEQPGAPPLLLLASTRPDLVLRDLVELRKRLPLPVQAGWGLPPSATPWGLAERPAPAPASGRRPPPPMAEDVEGRRRIATTLLVGAGAVALILLGEFRTRLELGDRPATTDVVLPIAMLLLLAFVAVVVLKDEVRLALDTDLLFERRICGVPVAKLRIPAAAIEGAFLVSPGAEQAPHHLLVSTAEGPVALRCDPAVGGPLVSSLASRRAASSGVA